VCTCRSKGKIVALGPEAAAYDSFDQVVTYVELWGWDLRPILKALEIEFQSQSDATRSTVEFTEMTFFNSQPTAKSVVPQMLDKLFGVSE